MFAPVQEVLRLRPTQRSVTLGVADASSVIVDKNHTMIVDINEPDICPSGAFDENCPESEAQADQVVVVLRMFSIHTKMIQVCLTITPPTTIILSVSCFLLPTLDSLFCWFHFPSQELQIQCVPDSASVTSSRVSSLPSSQDDVVSLHDGTILVLL